MSDKCLKFKAKGAKLKALEQEGNGRLALIL
jgi:hypothetical protein